MQKFILLEKVVLKDSNHFSKRIKEPFEIEVPTKDFGIYTIKTPETDITYPVNNTVDNISFTNRNNVYIFNHLQMFWKFFDYSESQIRFW